MPLPWEFYLLLGTHGSTTRGVRSLATPSGTLSASTVAAKECQWAHMGAGGELQTGRARELEMPCQRSELHGGLRKPYSHILASTGRTCLNNTHTVAVQQGLVTPHSPVRQMESLFLPMPYAPSAPPACSSVRVSEETLPNLHTPSHHHWTGPSPSGAIIMAQYCCRIQISA